MDRASVLLVVIIANTSVLQQCVAGHAGAQQCQHGHHHHEPHAGAAVCESEQLGAVLLRGHQHRGRRREPTLRPQRQV